MFFGERNTTEVERHSHYIASRGHTTGVTDANVNLDHWTRVCLSCFSTVRLRPPSIHTVLCGYKSLLRVIEGRLTV